MALTTAFGFSAGLHFLGTPVCGWVGPCSLLAPPFVSPTSSACFSFSALALARRTHAGDLVLVTSGLGSANLGL
eukprot:4453249-Alexandrium_andersonii.AAC.1